MNRRDVLKAVTLTIGATFAALVFAVHPLRVESVAWATERQDVLCGVLYLLTVLAYLRGIEHGGMIQRSWWVLSVSVFLLALLAKQAAMPLPAALLLIDIYPLKRVAAVGWPDQRSGLTGRAGGPISSRVRRLTLLRMSRRRRSEGFS